MNKRVEETLLSHPPKFFKSVCFGGDICGINGETPAELLHEFRQGIFEQYLSKQSIHVSHQSDRNFPELTFQKVFYLWKRSLLMKMGVLLILFLTMYTTSGRK